ncbi:hypothetical protein P3S67_010837 [Capsicum chacoense]
MQDPSNPNSMQLNQTPSLSATFRPSHHRRAHSEVNFRLPEDLDLVSDPFDASAASFEEIGSEDDFFSTYMDIEKLGTGSNPTDVPGFNNAAAGSSGGLVVDCGDGEKSFTRPRHRHSNSVDSSSLLLSESIEAKKAMAPDKLAELWTIDPKRAKRYVLETVRRPHFWRVTNDFWSKGEQLIFSLPWIISFNHVLLFGQ